MPEHPEPKAPALSSVFQRVHKDVWSGALFALLSIAVILKSRSYSIGSLSHMGSGYFPAMIGVAMLLVGVAIGAGGWLARPARVDKPAAPPEWRAWFLICLSLLLFVTFANHLGLVAATFATIFVSALADRGNTWRDAAGLAAAIVVFGVVVFWWLLKLPLPLFTWE